jgi:hypothetical protein
MSLRLALGALLENYIVSYTGIDGPRGPRPVPESPDEHENVPEVPARYPAEGPSEHIKTDFSGLRKNDPLDKPSIRSIH